MFTARTGYTGEDGAELLLSREEGPKLWRQLLERGVSPCGLGARDTLRLEAAMHLYGQALDVFDEDGRSWDGLQSDPSVQAFAPPPTPQNGKGDAEAWATVASSVGGKQYCPPGFGGMGGAAPDPVAAKYGFK